MGNVPGMGNESNAEGAIRRVDPSLAHGAMHFDKQGIQVHPRWKLWPHQVERQLDHPSLEVELARVTRGHSHYHPQVVALRGST